MHAGALEEIRDSIIFLISKMIQESIERPGANLALSREFAKKLAQLKHGGAIISTNYDIILDNALLTKLNSCNYGFVLRRNVGIEYQSNNRVHDFGLNWNFDDRLGSGGGVINQGGIPLLKLHGSLNWLYCPRCDEVDITIGQKGVPHLLTESSSRLCVNDFCTSHYDPVLVTPTMLKVYSLRPLKTLFELCEAYIARAKNLIFVGYSLPDADYALRSLVTKGLARNRNRRRLKTKVVDLKPETPEEKKWIQDLEARYKSLLGDSAEILPIGLKGFVDDFENMVGA